MNWCLRLSSYGLALVFSMMVAGLAQSQPQIGPPAAPAPQPAAPQTGGGMLIRIGPEVTAKAMQDAGYAQTETGKWSNGVAYARGVLNDIRVAANHEECNEAGCRLVVFWVDFGVQSTIDLEYMNAWNRAFRFARLYRDDRNHVVFIWHVPLYTGVAPDYLRVAASQYGSLLKDLMQYTPDKK